MPRLTCTQIEVYVFRRRGGRVEFLCLRRAVGQSLAGAWQPVTGKRARGERALAGAAREVLEETGLCPRRWWALESVSIYFDAAGDRVRVLPLFAAEVGPRDRIRLSPEHDAGRFLGAHAAGARFLWEAQRRGLEAVRREVLLGGALARALEVTRLLKTPAARRRERRPGTRLRVRVRSSGVSNSPR